MVRCLLGSRAIELNEELCLEAPASLIFVGTAHAQHRVHFVNENHRRLCWNTEVTDDIWMIALEGTPTSNKDTGRDCGKSSCADASNLDVFRHCKNARELL